MNVNTGRHEHQHEHGKRNHEQGMIAVKFIFDYGSGLSILVTATL